MKKFTFLAKALSLFSALLLGSGAFAQVELKLLTQPESRFNQVNDDGYGVAVYDYYDFATGELTPIESDAFAVESINNNKDVAGFIMYDEANFILQAGYRKDNVWTGIGFLPEQDPEQQDELITYKISSNSKYITGQANIEWNFGGFLYDTETQELTGVFDPEGEDGAYYAVNDNGIMGGWLDRPDQFGTLRVPAYRTLDGEFHLIPEGQLPTDTEINTINDINNSDVMVGAFNLSPFMYDKASNTFTQFENPGGGYEAAFSSVSENGIAIGFVEVGYETRDAIIYHPSLGAQPIFLKDLLIDNGIALDTADGLLGTAISISPNGKYIAGWVNGMPTTASGWMLYLDDLILGTNAVVNTKISVFPNPVENILTINASEKVDAIMIFNVLGQQVSEVIIDETNKQIDVSGLANGIYMLKVISNSTQDTFKIVKK